LQTLLPPLLGADRESTVVVTGGTHVPWSPPYHYLEQVVLPVLRQFGFEAHLSLQRWGWYPKGGGQITAHIHPARRRQMIPLDEPFELQQVSGISASSLLPAHIRERQARQAETVLRRQGITANISLLDASAASAGSFLFLCAHGKDLLAGFSALGKRGKRAEQVADEAVEAMLHFLRSGAAVDVHLADQILIYLAMLPGSHRMTVAAISRHLITNAWVVERFLPVRFHIEGDLNRPGTVVKKDLD